MRPVSMRTLVVAFAGSPGCNAIGDGDDLRYDGLGAGDDTGAGTTGGAAGSPASGAGGLGGLGGAGGKGGAGAAAGNTRGLTSEHWVVRYVIDEAGRVSFAPGNAGTAGKPQNVSAVRLGLGNFPEHSSSIGGTLHDAAIYADALNEDEVAANAAHLLVNDDSP